MEDSTMIRKIDPRYVIPKIYFKLTKEFKILENVKLLPLNVKFVVPGGGRVFVISNRSK